MYSFTIDSKYLHAEVANLIINTFRNEVINQQCTCTTFLYDDYNHVHDQWQFICRNSLTKGDGVGGVLKLCAISLMSAINDSSCAEIL